MDLQAREFEKFRGGPTPHSSQVLHVTIQRTGRIFMNANTYRKLGKPEAVCLYFNRERNMIVLEEASPRMPESFPVLSHLSGGVRVHAAPFCHHFGIRIDETLKFIRPDIEGRQLILDLSHTIVAKRLRKKKSR